MIEKPAKKITRRRTKVKFNIGGQNFTSKKAVLQFCRTILNSGEETKILRGRDDVFVRELFKYHEKYLEKAGTGIKNIRVQLCRDYGSQNREFIIQRQDGTSSDISYISCLNKTSRITMFARACRTAVHDQIMMFRQSCQGIVKTCCLSGSPINIQTDTHVDHIIPFDTLVHDFITQENIDVEVLQYTDDIHPTDCRITEFLPNSDLKKKFADFHRRKASLRLVTANANLTRKRKESSCS